MPTVEMKFGPAAMKRALAESDGRHPSNAALVLSDPAETGLTIRVSGRSAGWFLRWNGKFKRLGGVGSPDVRAERRESGYIYTGKDAVELGGRVREMMKLGLDVDAYLAARALGVGHEQANATGATIAARDSGAWTFATMAERFVAERISQPKITSKGIIKPAKPRTIQEARSILRHPDVIKALDSKLVRDIQKKDVENIRALWWDDGNGAKGRQHKLIVYVKSTFTWAKQHHSAAQLDDIAPWWSELRHNPYATKAEIAAMAGKLAAPLTACEVAMVLHVAERNRVAPDRKIRLETTETALAALWWVALTAQRTHAAYQVKIDRIEDRTQQEGWFEVSWMPADMKSGRHFSLAVPPAVFDRTLGRALRDPHRRKDSVWVFPSSRTKLRGRDEHADKPVGDTILISLLKRLRGIRDGKKVDEDQLAAAGLPYFTLHEIRDALTTHLASHTTLPSGTASAILDHASKDDGDRDNKEASVTREHYNKSKRLGLKFAGLEAWADAVLKEYEDIERRRRVEVSRGQLARRPVMPKKKPAKRVRERADAEWAAFGNRNAMLERQPITLDLKKLPKPAHEEELEPHEFVSLRDE